MLKKQIIEVTDRVVGKIKGNEIALYLENELIGKIPLPEGVKLELEHHFETNQNKIYQHITNTIGTDARYTDCDEGGWC